MVKAALADIEVNRARYRNQQQLSETAQAVITCFKAQPETRLKVSDIVTATSLPRRTVQYALKQLTERGILQRMGQGAGSRYQLVF